MPLYERPNLTRGSRGEGAAVLKMQQTCDSPTRVRRTRSRRALRRPAIRSANVALALLSAIEKVDRRGHSLRVAWLARRLARVLGFGAEVQNDIRWAGLLHDIGKLQTPCELLSKRGPLTASEFEVIKRHPTDGATLLRGMPGIARLRPAILHHHENFDGSGYPAGLRGERIPLSARLLRVCDSFDAMTSDRPYRPALGVNKALRLIKSNTGHTADPDLVGPFARTIHGLMRTPSPTFRKCFSHLRK